MQLYYYSTQLHNSNGLICIQKSLFCFFFILSPFILIVDLTFGIRIRTKKTFMSNLEPNRQLSAYESAIVYRGLENIYYNFIVAAKYETALSPEIIKQTLARLCHKYAQFSLHVNLPPPEISTVAPLPTVSYLPSWDITDSIIDIVNDPLDAVFATYMQFQFQYPSITPLWRVLYNPTQNILYFVADHTFFDGTAGKNFHIQFASLLEESTDVSLHINTASFPHIVPNPAVLMKFRSNIQPNPPTTTPTPQQSTTRPIICPELMQLSPLPAHRSTLFQLTSIQVQSLLKLSQNAGVKLTSFLYAIAATSILQIPDMDGQLFKTMIPINSRPLLSANSRNSNLDWLEFGLYFGKYFHTDSTTFLSESSIITIAQHFHSSLHDNIPLAMQDYELVEAQAKQNPNVIVNNIKQLYNRNNQPLTTLVISNLGTTTSSNLKEMYFDQPMVDACFGIQFIGCSQGGITLNFTSHRAVPTNQYDHYVKTVQAKIQTIISNRSSPQ